MFIKIRLNYKQFQFLQNGNISRKFKENTTSYSK